MSRDPAMLAAYNDTVSDKSLTVERTKEEKEAAKAEKLTERYGKMSDEELHQSLQLIHSELASRSSDEDGDFENRFLALYEGSTEEFREFVLKGGRDTVQNAIHRMRGDKNALYKKADKKIIFRLTEGGKKLLKKQANGLDVSVSEYVVDAINYRLVLDNVKTDAGTQAILRVPKSGDHIIQMFAERENNSSDKAPGDITDE